MGTSIHAAMNDLVVADATRMSGSDFADARGAGVARRVRTRRTVRAVGVGGASALAVGALAVGAAHLPRATSEVPVAGVGGCASPWPYGIGSRYVVQERYADYLPDDVSGAWSLLDVTTGDTVFAVSPAEVGSSWLVTYPSGATETVPFTGAGEVRVDVPDGPSIVLTVWMVDGGTEMAVTAYSETPGGPLMTPHSACDTQGATPTPTPSSSVVRPSADPSLAARTERVTSPFQCGFVFDQDSSDAPGLEVTGTAWVTPAASSDWGDNSGDPQWDDSASSFGENAAHAVVHVSAGDWVGVSGGRDPGDAAVRAAYGGYNDGTYTGVTFVSVRDGVVVGTFIDDLASSDAVMTLSAMDDGNIVTGLHHPESAFEACPGEQPSDVSVDVYVVASAVTMEAGNPSPVADPEYAWRHIGGFRGNVPSNYFPSN